MKTLAILSLGLAVALGMPSFVPDVAQNPVFTEKEQSPLLGDLVPVQGHVVVKDPAPQVRLGFREQREKMAPETDQSPLNVHIKKASMMEQEVEVKPEVKMEPMEKEGMVELEIKVKPEDKVDPELKAEEEVQMERDVKVDPEAKADTEVHLNPEVMAELEVKVKSEVKMESELNVGPDLKVESEVKVEPDVQWEPEVKPQEEFQMEMNHEEETETNLEVEERHIDVEGKYEKMGEPIEELEPLDDDSMFGEELSNTELSEVEKSLRAAFQSRDPDTEPLPEEEGLMDRSNDVLDEEPIMEPEPKMREEPFLHQQVMPGSAIMDEGPALDIMGQQIPPLGDYFPNEEAMMGMELAKQHEEGAGSEFVREEESPMDGMPLFEEPAMEDSPLLDEGVQNDVVPEKEKRTLMQQEVNNTAQRRLLPKDPFLMQGSKKHFYTNQGLWILSPIDCAGITLGRDLWTTGMITAIKNSFSSHIATRQCSCPGVVLERKCYQFFRGPKRAEDAEYFCQQQAPGGHLASITSQYIHREVMKMMLWQNGAYTRTWIGGLRYLGTGHFIWLDGSHWSYADWLSGEPNDTANVEDCLEVLAFGNGKFNDFTCWEPQAFICSYPY